MGVHRKMAWHEEGSAADFEESSTSAIACRLSWTCVVRRELNLLRPNRF